MTKDKENGHLSYLFFIIQGQKFKIMELIGENELSFKQIQLQLEELNDEEVHNFSLERNLAFLIENNIVEKFIKRINDTEKSKEKEKKDYHLYKLTNFGLQVYGMSPTYRYLWNNKSYFLGHSALDLPPTFYYGMGIFANETLEKIEGRPNIYSKLIDMYRNAEFVYNIVFELEASKEVTDILLHNLRSNSLFHTKTIVGSNKRLDPHRPSKISDFEKYKESNRVLQKEIVESVHISVYVTDKEAFISFPKEKETNPDTEIILFGKGGNFHQWCMDYFNYCWEKWKGKPHID